MQKLKIRLKVYRHNGKPLASEPCALVVDGQTQTTTTDADGMLIAQSPSTAQQAELRVGARTYTLAIGHLDPPSSALGWRARLRNMGFLHSDLESASDEEVAHALHDFQAAQRLPPTSEVDSSTINMLAEEHGV